MKKPRTRKGQKREMENRNWKKKRAELAVGNSALGKNPGGDLRSHPGRPGQGHLAGRNADCKSEIAN
jgi:hypothetical protein